MTITANTNRSDYTGNNTTATYPYNFRILEDEDLTVVVQNTVTGVETTLTLNTDYTVTNVGGTTGNVVLVDLDQAWLDASGFLDADYDISILRVRDVTQEYDIRNQGSYYPETIEDALDSLVMIDQQQQDDIGRSLKLPLTEAPTDEAIIIPTVAQRANKFFGWDADGNPVASSSVADIVVLSDIGEDLAQAADTLAARTAIDAAQTTNNLPEVTSPAIGDFAPIYDLSSAGDRKISLSNLLKVMDGLTAHTAPIKADSALVYDSGASAAKKVILADLMAVASRIGVFNIGLAAATTSVSNDSIKIQGASATLSASNPAYINIPSTTAGLLSTFRIVADVTINLTGLHGGRGATGNWTDVPYALYAINDTGAIKYGVSPKPNLASIASTSTSATGSSVDTYSKMLVNSALNSGTWPCTMIGWFLVDFNDTGDVNTVQTGAGEINVGVPFPLPTSNITTYGAPSGAGGHGSTNTKIRRTNGPVVVGTAILRTDTAAAGTVFTIMEDGIYTMNYNDYDSTNPYAIGITLNTNDLTTSVASLSDEVPRLCIASAVATVFANVSATRRLVQGDLIRMHTSGTPDALANCRFSITKVSH